MFYAVSVGNTEDRVFDYLDTIRATKFLGTFLI